MGEMVPMDSQAGEGALHRTAIETVAQLKILRSVLDIKWNGPEPEFIPVEGKYVCAEADGDTLRALIQSGKLPMPGVMPGVRFLSLREMIDFQIMQLMNRDRAV